jgi:hypothetical protein
LGFGPHSGDFPFTTLIFIARQGWERALIKAIVNAVWLRVGFENIRKSIGIFSNELPRGKPRGIHE